MKTRKGFTLVEVIVSIALLGLIAVGFLMALTGYVRYISVTKTITQDIFQAQEKLELDIQTVKSNIRNGTTGGLTEQTFAVFGQSFVGYPLVQQVEQHKLNTVVGSAIPIDLPV
ncbi:MAG: type II secretion system protein, partial [Clostridiaceae bacterium]|nr:type II secretion system protein [Clostridiaceae bacterium]